MTQQIISMHDAFSREHGSGSASAEEDFTENESIYTNEWGSIAATSFNPSDEDANGNSLSYEKKQYYKQLYAINNGKGRKTRKGEIRSSHIKNDAKTFMSVLEIPTPQRKRITHILTELDISSNNFGGRCYEKIILAVCSLVCDEALSRQLRERYDDLSTISDDINLSERRLYGKEQYKELMDTMSMSGTEHRKIREQVRERSKYFTE